MEAYEITRGAATAINDYLENCLEIKPGDEVVIAAQVDGLQGGDNLVDHQTITWLQNALMLKGANPSVLWFDETAKMHNWRIPPVFMSALKASDVFINCSFDLTIEELKEIPNAATDFDVRLSRLMATTAELLNSPWAQTPYELVSEIRYQACVPFKNGGMPYELTDPNGTHLTGTILPASHPRFPAYTRRRNEGPGYRPFPEWIFPPVNLGDTNGTLVFDRMLSWWSRYLGIAPVFKPITLKIENSRIVSIEGGQEADRLKEFLGFLETKFGDSIYNFNEVHSGVHPCAVVPPQLCNRALVQRVVNHSEACNIHFHIGAPWPNEKYPYWPHITADIRNATWKVGDTYIHKEGHLCALDHPKVLEIAEKYPDRPGLGFCPRNY